MKKFEMTLETSPKPRRKCVLAANKSEALNRLIKAAQRHGYRITDGVNSKIVEIK